MNAARRIIIFVLTSMYFTVGAAPVRKSIKYNNILYLCFINLNVAREYASTVYAPPPNYRYYIRYNSAYKAYLHGYTIAAVVIIIIQVEYFKS